VFKPDSITCVFEEREQGTTSIDEKARSGVQEITKKSTQKNKSTNIFKLPSSNAPM